MDLCPVQNCGKTKETWHLTCARHWSMVPKPKQMKLYGLYKNGPGSPEHREMCFQILEALNARETEGAKAEFVGGPI